MMRTKAILVLVVCSAFAHAGTVVRPVQSEEPGVTVEPTDPTGRVNITVSPVDPREYQPTNTRLGGQFGLFNEEVKPWFNNGKKPVGRVLPTTVCKKNDFDREVTDSKNYKQDLHTLYDMWSDFQRVKDKFREEDFPLWAYTHNFYQTINRMTRQFFVRGGEDHQRYKCWYAAMINLAVNKKVQCHRGDQNQYTYKQGEDLHSNQFESCSLEPKIACQFSKVGATLFVITANRAIDATVVTKYKEEKENILPPGKNFKVIKVTPDYVADAKYGPKCQGKKFTLIEVAQA